MKPKTIYIKFNNGEKRDLSDIIKEEIPSYIDLSLDHAKNAQLYVDLLWKNEPENIKKVLLNLYRKNGDEIRTLTILERIFQFSDAKQIESDE